MKCPFCHSTQEFGTMICQCGYSFLEGKMKSASPTSSQETETKKITSKFTIYRKNRWRTFGIPLIVGGMTINCIVLGVYFITKSKSATALSQPIAFSIGGFIMGYLAGDIPLVPVVTVFLHLFLSKFKMLFKEYNNATIMITTIIFLFVYFAIFYGATYYGAKYVKKDKPKIVL